MLQTIRETYQPEHFDFDSLACTCPLSQWLRGAEVTRHSIRYVGEEGPGRIATPFPFKAFITSFDVTAPNNLEAALLAGRTACHESHTYEQLSHFFA